MFECRIDVRNYDMFCRIVVGRWESRRVTKMSEYKTQRRGLLIAFSHSHIHAFSPPIPAVHRLLPLHLPTLLHLSLPFTSTPFSLPSHSLTPICPLTPQLK